MRKKSNSIVYLRSGLEQFDEQITRLFLAVQPESWN